MNCYLYWFSILLVALGSFSSQAAPIAGLKFEQRNMALGCNIRIQVPLRAVVTASRENRGSGGITVENPRNIKSRNYIQPFYTSFICYDSSDSIVGGGAISRDATSGQWVRNVDKLIKSSGVDWTHEEIRQQEMAIRVYSLKAVNAEGYAYTIDDLIGDKKDRRRLLRYCLIRPPKALCGHGEMGYLKDGLKADLTEYALNILRSIEFLEYETPLPEADASEATQTISPIPQKK